MLARAAECRPLRRDFQSVDPGETVEYVGRTLAPHRMDMVRPGPMSAKLRCFELGHTQIVDIQYGTEVWVDPGELQSHFLIHAAVSGRKVIWRGEEELPLQPDNIVVSSPGRPMRAHITPESRDLTVRLPQWAFEDYLMNAMKIPVNRPLIFFHREAQDKYLPVAWRAQMAHVMQQAADFPELMANPRLQRHFATTFIELLLSNYRHSYSDQVALSGNDVTPWHVRRARDIIHENLAETVSIADLASQVGVSVRSLQNGFRQFLGVKPVEYVRRCRLEKLHDALLECDEDRTSVTELMLDCGIANFGRYAQYYRQQYGCRPSDTIRRRR